MVIVYGLSSEKRLQNYTYIEYCLTLVEMCTAVSDQSLILPVILLKCTSFRHFHIFVILIISLWPSIASFGCCDEEGKSTNKFSILHQPIKKLAFSKYNHFIVAVTSSSFLFFFSVSFPLSSWLR